MLCAGFVLLVHIFDEPVDILVLSKVHTMIVESKESQVNLTFGTRASYVDEEVDDGALGETVWADPGKRIDF